jgi:hypothetical protein
MIGIGAETLTIAIEVLVTVYFEDHELSLAYGILIAVSRAGDTLPCVSPGIQDWLFGSDSSWSSTHPIGFGVLLWLCVFMFALGLVSLIILFYLEGNDICTDVDAADDEEIAAVEPDDTSLRAAISHLTPQFWLFVGMHIVSSLRSTAQSRNNEMNVYDINNSNGCISNRRLFTIYYLHTRLFTCRAWFTNA